MSTATLNLDTLPHETFRQLMRLDMRLKGTPNYMGIAYFWHHDYKHYLRDCTYAQRRKIHHKLLKHNLQLDGESEAHDQIILQVLHGKKLSSGWVVTETKLREDDNG